MSVPKQVRRRRKSLARQVLLRLFLITTFVLLAAEIFTIERSHRALSVALDKALLARAEGLALVTEFESDGEIEFDFADELMRDFSGPKPRAYFLILRLADNFEIERSQSLQKQELALPKPPGEIATGEPFFWDTRIDARRVRFVALRGAARKDADSEKREPAMYGKSECLFVVGLDRKDIDRRFWDIVERTSTALGMGLVLLLLTGWIVVRRSLQPLSDLEKEVQSLSASSLTPVSVPQVREIAVVAETINRSIQKIKEAFERERRFTADVAHELRTPISEIRSTAEVSLKWTDRLDDENVKNYADILASAGQMQDLVNNLLTLARCDAGALKRQEQVVRLDQLISSVWDRFDQEAASKSIRVRHTVPSGLAIVTDADMFETILMNLFSNAVDYTPEDGTIEWSVIAREDECSFSISNSVVGLSEEDLPHLFERFWQKDQARVKRGTHSGLGLSLVESLATLLGLSVSARLASPGVLTIALTRIRTEPSRSRI